MTRLRRNAVPLAISGVLVLLALVCHARLVAWFAGEPTPGSGSAPGVPVGSGSGPGSDAVAYYTCSMHPSVHAHAPGTCPVCAMNLVPVTRADEQSAVVQLDEARQRAIGVRTEPVV
jgi:Cu(I)/Ag(I) efflux system membrane fusion protein